jgi:hypothetical protein
VPFSVFAGFISEIDRVAVFNAASASIPLAAAFETPFFQESSYVVILYRHGLRPSHSFAENPSGKVPTCKASDQQPPDTSSN